MNATAARRLVWDWPDKGTDRATVLTTPDGLQISSQHAETRYWLHTDPNHAAISLKVQVDRAQPLDLRRDRDGWHHLDGSLVPGSAMAIDPDIACTALTNTLPIRRLGLGIGDTAAMDVLYLPVPDLTPRIVRQRYTRTDHGYRYQNLQNGFEALLSVDNDGWVTDYPGVCLMMEPPQ
ncbi:MAG: putative glycolipid-binding domain-containing protein [Pseudomonadota bacterium]